MRRIFLMAMMIIACHSLSYSQVETHYLNKGEASKLINKPVRTISDVKVMPSFDLAQLEKEDAERDSTASMFRFGKPFDVSYTLADGQWENVEGGRMWSMTFKSEGALSLNFVFNDFHLPEGAELYVMNKDESVLFGPVTKECTTENGFFLTDIIRGDQASILLFEPNDSKGMSSLVINRVVHGYRGLESSVESSGTRTSTNQDVACSPDYTLESDAVAMILYSEGFYVGTGFLIMSADYSFKPYLLTSSYNVDVNDDGEFSYNEIDWAENSMFKFRYKKTQCNGTEYVDSYTCNQAYFRAGWNTNYSTKFALLELKSNLKSKTELAWLGWYNYNYYPSSGACIHHPTNDVMKISTFNYTLSFFETYLWLVHFTEGYGYYGTRGAPLLDQNKRVAGHVYRTIYEDINSLSTNFSKVGKFYLSWNGGGTDTSRLKNWLDPNNTGVLYMNSRRPLGDLHIMGDSVIHTDGSNVFYVSNLPSGTTVHWQINSSYYDGVLEQDEPYINQCTIEGDPDHEVVNATLTAYVYSGSSLAQIVTKKVSTQEIFHGTYYNGQTTKQINLPNPLYVLPGTNVYITSPNLVGASVYYEGNVTPYTWTFNSTTGALYVGMPSSPSGTAAIIVHVTTALGNSFTLPIVRASVVYSISVGTGLGQITISLAENDRGIIQPIDGGSKLSSWKLEVYNSTNGNKVFSQEVEGESFVIDTTGWDPGIYIVKAYIGDEVLSEKIVVK